MRTVELNELRTMMIVSRAAAGWAVQVVESGGIEDGLSDPALRWFLKSKRQEGWSVSTA